MVESLDMSHSEAKFFSISVPLRLENKLSAPKI